VSRVQRRLVVRRLGEGERTLLREHLREAWRGPEVVSRGRLRDASRLPAFACVDDGVIGFATYEIRGKECELVTIGASREDGGVGSALLAAVAEEARSHHGCDRLWLITTNDNMRALRFYQRRGLRLVAVHRGAVDEARAVKPAIPVIGNHGIPIHDEIELELDLRPGRTR
jgi:GNAT superfamily N-acetyltransferase